LQAPALFALLFQGINGLIQVAAFFGLAGPSYLAFTAAYITGTIVSILFVLNFENTLLAGAATRSVRLYFVVFWLVGLASALAAVLWHSTVPSVVTFCCWGVCFRLFLAWATHAKPAPSGLLLAGSLAMATCLLGDLPQLLVVAMLVFPLAAVGAAGPAVTPGDGFVLEARASVTAFAKYLPHTLSGLLLGYVDRYLALGVVGGAGAEVYLRTVQVCSWAAFLAYPVVFQARARVLQAGTLDGGKALRVAGNVGATIAVAVAAILTVAYHSGRMPVLEPVVVALAFGAVVCSQSYQIVSTLNFVGQRFGIINRITLSSAATVLLLGALLVPAVRTPVVLALVYFSGWFVQFGLTVMILRRRPG
jgi:hypothetical protein